MAVTLDLRTALTLTFPDSAVTYANGGAEVDLTGTAPGALQIADNLSDLDDADTALANLGGTATGIALFKTASPAAARTTLGGTATGVALFTAASASAARTTLEVTLATLTGVAPVAVTTAGAIYLQVPTGITGTVSLITGVTNGAPGGDTLFTGAIGTSGGAYTDITSGTFTVLSAATAGTRFVATPSAANAVTGGTSIIRVSWDAGAAAAVLVGLTIEITRS
jgi:hypothetical protein